MGTYHKFIINTKLVKKDKKTKEQIKKIVEKLDHPKVLFSETQGVSIDDCKWFGQDKFFNKLKQYLVGTIRDINLDDGYVVDYYFGDSIKFKKDYPDYYVKLKV